MKKVRSTIIILALILTVNLIQAAPLPMTSDDNRQELFVDYMSEIEAVTLDFILSNMNNPLFDMEEEGLFDDLTVYPNPSSNRAFIDFKLDEHAVVKVRVLNMLGQNVLNVFEGDKYAGSHQIVMDVDRLQPGTYLIRLTANETVRTIRFVKNTR